MGKSRKAGVDMEKLFAWKKNLQQLLHSVESALTQRRFKSEECLQTRNQKDSREIQAQLHLLPVTWPGKAFPPSLQRAVNAVYASSSPFAVKMLEIAWFQPLRHLSWTKENFSVPFNIYFDFYSSRAPRKERRQSGEKTEKWTSALMINKQVVCRQHKRFIISVRPRAKGCINVRFGWRSKREGPREAWSGCKASEPLQSMITHSLRSQMAGEASQVVERGEKCRVFRKYMLSVA